MICIVIFVERNAFKRWFHICCLDTGSYSSVTVSHLLLSHMYHNWKSAACSMTHKALGKAAFLSWCAVFLCFGKFFTLLSDKSVVLFLKHADMLLCWQGLSPLRDLQFDTTHRDLFSGNVCIIHPFILNTLCWKHVWKLTWLLLVSVFMSFCSDGDDYLQQKRVLVDQFRQKNDPEWTTEFHPWCYPLKERPLSPLRKRQKQGTNTKCKNWIIMNNKYLLF